MNREEVIQRLIDLWRRKDVGVNETIALEIAVKELSHPNLSDIEAFANANDLVLWSKEYSEKAFKALTAIDDIKAEIEEIRLDVHAELFKQDYRNFYLSGAHGALVRVLEIIDKHTSGKESE